MTGRDANPVDPMEAARRFSRPVLPKRFYARAELVAEDGGFALRLDGKGARTPARNRLVISGPLLAEAVAAEWNAQGEVIDPATMPATRLANTAIDGVAPRLDEVRAEILSYGGTDLLFYRAGDPEGLVARQREAWDPILRLGRGASWRALSCLRRASCTSPSRSVPLQRLPLRSPATTTPSGWPVCTSPPR